MCLVYVYHGTTKGEGCGHVNSIKAPSNIFIDRCKAVLLLWFTISAIVCLCMYVFVTFLILDSRWAIFGEETVLLAFCL